MGSLFLPIPSLCPSSWQSICSWAGTNSHFWGGGGGESNAMANPPSPLKEHGMGRVPPQIAKGTTANCADLSPSYDPQK